MHPVTEKELGRVMDVSGLEKTLGIRGMIKLPPLVEKIGIKPTKALGKPYWLSLSPIFFSLISPMKFSN